MNRLQEQELIDAMADIHRLRAALEAAERRADHWREWARALRPTAFEWMQQADALREQVEAAREALLLASICTGSYGGGLSEPVLCRRCLDEISAALARLDQRETGAKCLCGLPKGHRADQWETE